MSILQGTLTVVVATVIASGMIVLTGNGVADDKQKIKAGAEDTVSTKQSDGMPKKLSVVEKQANEAVSEAFISGVNNIPLAPPPGPFLNENVIAAQKYLLAPAAPKAPISLVKTPELRAKSLHFKIAPSLPQKAVAPKTDLNKPLSPTVLSIAPQSPQIDKKIEPASPSGQSPKQAMMPKLKAIIAPAPIEPINITKQPEMKTTDIPIWAQGGNVAKRGSNSYSNNAIQKNQAVMGVPNIGWNNNYPVQQYIYVPVPMMPSNMSPPQMPMFNGNIMPPSNYWGAPMPPSNAPNITIQKESTGSKNAPMQKGNK